MFDTILLALMGLALFAILSLGTISAYRLIKLRRQPPPAKPKSAAPAPDDDIELIRFMMKLDPSFKRQFPTMAAKAEGLPPPGAGYAPPALSKIAVSTGPPASSAPAMIRERAQPQLISETPMPVPTRIRADPRVIGGKTSPMLEFAPPMRQPAALDDVDPDLVALVELWDDLSARDRHELLQLARLKLGLPTH